MNLAANEVKMLKHLLQICFEEKLDLYIDDIKTFNSLRHRLNAKNPLKNDTERDVVKKGHEDKLKSQARKFWNKRNRRKVKKNLNQNGQ